MKASTIIRNAKKKHFLKFKVTPDVEALVRYAMWVSYNLGWCDAVKKFKIACRTAHKHVAK